MRDAQKSYIVVGSFVLVMLGALVGWLAVLTGRTGTTEAYYIEYENVMGLTEGAQILYGGYRVGQIEGISPALVPSGPGYRLDVSIRKGVRIAEDSVAVVTQSGFLSAIVIDIQAGHSARALEAGSQIPSQRATNLLTALASLAADFRELSETSLKPFLKHLTGGSDLLETLTKDGPVIIGNLKTFTHAINETTDRVNALLASSGGRVERVLGTLETVSTDISDLVHDLSDTRRSLDTLLVSTNELVTKNRKDIDHSIADFHYTLEVVASHVREISSNVEATTRNLNEFSAQIRRDPGVIIRGRGFDDDQGVVE